MTHTVDPQERRLIAKALVIGVVVWAVVFPLKLLVHGGFELLVTLLEASPTVTLIVPLLLVGALLTAMLSRNAGSTYFRDAEGKLHELNVVEGDGLERAISLYFSSEPALDRALLGEQGVRVRWRLPTLSLALRKWLATLCTLCTGGSGGLEASVTLIGESIAATLLKPRAGFAVPNRTWLRPLHRAWEWWRVSDPDDLQTAQLCGIAAAIATLLGAPFAGAFFAVEVMYRRRPIIDKLIFALVSALVAFFLTDLGSRHEAVFELGQAMRPPIHSARYYAALLGVALTLAVVAIQFRRLRSVLDHFFHTRFPNLWLRHALGAVGTAIVVLFVALCLYLWQPAGDLSPIALVLGPGEGLINAAIAGRVTLAVAVLALVAKLVATLTTITSGGSAGLLFPTMFFGAMVATAWANLLGIAQPVVVIGPAMCASLVSIVNVPLAAILFTIEVFGASYMVPALVTLVLASVLTHENSIYRAQRETFDNRQILPGHSVRRVRVPEEWAGRTIADLRVRSRFGLNVIGMIDRSDEDPRGYEQERSVLNPPPDQCLTQGDLLLLLGPDSKLDEFEAFVRTSLARHRERKRKADQSEHESSSSP